MYTSCLQFTVICVWRTPTAGQVAPSAPINAAHVPTTLPGTARPALSVGAVSFRDKEYWVIDIDNTTQPNPSQHQHKHITTRYNAMQYIEVRYDTMKYSTMQYSSKGYNTIHHNTMQYNVIQYNTMDYNAIQYNLINSIIKQHNNAVCNDTTRNDTIQINVIQPSSIQFNLHCCIWLQSSICPPLTQHDWSMRVKHYEL